MHHILPSLFGLWPIPSIQDEQEKARSRIRDRASDIQLDSSLIS
jgi:hypothetical protein